jgi:hypothetical protein
MSESEPKVDPPKDRLDPEITDPHNVPITFVNWVVTSGRHNEIINVTLGTVNFARPSANGTPASIVVGAQLRFTVEFGAILYEALGQALGRPGHEAPPDSPPPVPKNSLN